MDYIKTKKIKYNSIYKKVPVIIIKKVKNSKKN